MDEQTVISRYFAKLGSSKSRSKMKAIRENVKKANAATRSPIQFLEKAYRAVKDGKKTLTAAAISPGKCSYYTLRAYAKRRDGGETMDQIKANP